MYIFIYIFLYIYISIYTFLFFYFLNVKSKNIIIKKIIINIVYNNNILQFSYFSLYISFSLLINTVLDSKKKT